MTDKQKLLILIAVRDNFIWRKLDNPQIMADAGAMNLNAAIIKAVGVTFIKEVKQIIAEHSGKDVNDLCTKGEVERILDKAIESLGGERAVTGETQRMFD